MSVLRVCTKCLLEKELTEFYRNIKLKDNLEGRCKSCKKEERTKRKESISLYNKKYSKKNKDKLNTYKRDRYIGTDKEVIKSKSKNYYINNKEKASESQKNWKEKNKEKIKSYKKNHSKVNRQKINIARNKRIQVDPVYKMSQSIRGCISHYLKINGYKKNIKPMRLLVSLLENLKII